MLNQQNVLEFSYSAKLPATLKMNSSMKTYKTFQNQHPKKMSFSSQGTGMQKVGSQETGGVTGKFGLGVQNEAGQRLIEFCKEKSLVIANTLFQQHKRRLYTWRSPDSRRQNQIDYILCSLLFQIPLYISQTPKSKDKGYSSLQISRPLWETFMFILQALHLYLTCQN